MRTIVAPLEEEQSAARRKAISEAKEVEPTEEEKKNGWTKKTLTKYLAEREAARQLQVDVNSLTRKVARRKDVQNHRYRPLRWRE